MEVKKLHSSVSPPQTISRRQWLKQVAAFSATGLLAACQVIGNEPDTTLRREILASPQPPTGASSDDQPVDQSLTNFLALSAALTGFNPAVLSPTLGRVYLNSLQADDELSLRPNDLYDQFGLSVDDPPTLESLTEAGLFDQTATQKLADTIIEYWYTGIYKTAEGEQAVATAVDSLTWKAITYAPPNTICGPSPDFWEVKPNIAPIPAVHEAGFAG